MLLARPVAIALREKHAHSGLKVLLVGAVAMFVFSLSLSVAAWSLSNGPDVTTRTWTKASLAHKPRAKHPPHR